MDHFALPDDELGRALEARTLHRNFMGYTVQSARDMVALGVSAIGDVQGAFVQNTKKLPEYYAALDAGRFPIERGYALDEDDAIRRHVITELMCNGRLDIRDVERRFGVTFAEYFAPELADLAAPGSPAADGLVAGRRRRARRDAGRAGCSCATSAWCSIATCAPAPAAPRRSSAARYEHAPRRRGGRGITGLAAAVTLADEAARAGDPLSLRRARGGSARRRPRRSPPARMAS